MKVTTVATGPAIAIINRHTEQITKQTELIKMQQQQLNELERVQSWNMLTSLVIVAFLGTLLINKIKNIYDHL